jgi:phosphomannomutase
MVTASHNPKQYNGCKMVYDRKPFFGDQLQHLKKLMQEDDGSLAATVAKVEKKNIIADYINNATSNLKPLTRPDQSFRL